MAVFLAFPGCFLTGFGFFPAGQGDVTHPGAAWQGGNDEPLAYEAADAGGQRRAVNVEGAHEVGVGDAGGVRMLRTTALLTSQPVQDGLLKGREFQLLVMYW